MSKFNLSEAAADILAQSKASAGSEPYGAGKKLTKTPGQEVQELGTAGHKMTDPNYDATKGLKKATLPTGSGVAAEPMKKLSGEPQQTMGRKDLASSPEGEETSCSDKVDRKKGPVAKATSSANKGAKTPYVPEGEEDEDWEPEDQDEWEDEELEEATMEEVQRDLKELDDKKFAKKYGMSKKEVSAKLAEMQQKDSMKEEASVEEVLEDLEEMDDETFEETYGLSKEDAVSHLEEMEKESCKAEEKKAKKAKLDASMKEDIDAMLSGETLSEEFKDKASMIFEAAVNSRVELVAEEMEQAFIEQFNEAVEEVKEDFAGKLDSYLDYVVENWMEENKLSIEKGLRSEIVEDFIGALKNVFEEHYIDIPEEKVDVVEELVSKVEELEDTVNEHIERNIELKKRLYEHERLEAVNAVCEGLTLSQAEKIKSLAKSVEFVSEEDFAEKLETIKESYFPSYIKSASIEDLNEPVELDEDATTKVVDPLIEQYASKISKLTKF
jgi:transposase